MENTSNRSMQLLGGVSRLSRRVLLAAFISVLTVPQTTSSNASTALFGVVFARDAQSEKLASIDPVSGAITPIGSGVANCCKLAGNGSALDPNNGVLYFVAAGFYESSPRLFALDTPTGAVRSSPVLPTSMFVNYLELQSTPVPKPVDIDIKPGSFPNSINLASAGVVPVAILSSPTFDATQVDPATVTLAGAAVKLIGKGSKYSCSAQDVNSDGLTDLVCHVETAQFLIEPGDSVAVLEGQTFSGLRIRGENSIQIVP